MSPLYRYAEGGLYLQEEVRVPSLPGGGVMSQYENHSLPVRAASGVRVVFNEVPGLTRSFIRMQATLKVAWVCCVVFYVMIGVGMDAGVWWSAVFTVVFTAIWTGAFAVIAETLDATD